MIAVLQRVKRAAVDVDGSTVGRCEAGLCILLGVAKGDTEKDAEALADKILGLRIFCDENDKMNLSVRDVEAAVKAANKAYGQEIADAEEEESGVKVDYIHSLETRFTNFTGRRCKISTSKNKKMFQLEYRDNEDLEDLLKKLAGAGIFEDY